MIDRIVMTCPKCGSDKKSVTLVTDPCTNGTEVLANLVGYQYIQSDCLTCGFYSCKTVCDQGLWNLLRCVGIADQRFANRVRLEFAEEPSTWKQWRTRDKLSLSEVRLRHGKVRSCLTAGIPDNFAYFNAMSTPRGGRRTLSDWLAERQEFSEWRALCAAVWTSPGTDVSSRYLAQALRSAVVGK